MTKHLCRLDLYRSDVGDERYFSQAVPGQIESHLTGEVEDSVLFKPFKNLDEKSNLGQTDVKRLQAGAKETIKSGIRPAFRKLLRWDILKTAT